MPEYRRDPILGQWVIVHTDDSWEPDKYPKEEQKQWHKATCPFCPGREHFTPKEVDAVRFNGSQANSSDWKVRVVPNKFPALKIEGEIGKHLQGIYDASNGVGAHEVLIETPFHEKNMADYSTDELVYVIQKYQSRVVDLTGDKRFKYIIIFKNYGTAAGASIEHAHSQIIALPMIPKYVLQEIEGAKRYYTKHNRCVFCDIVKQEYENNLRIIADNENFVSFSPFVPRYPFENWIFPKKHTSDFASINPGEQKSLAAVLKETLLRLKTCLSDPSFNFFFHISPINSKEVESFHWHIEIIPKLTHMSGFEWGTGFYVVHTEPSIAARYLKEVQL